MEATRIAMIAAIALVLVGMGVAARDIKDMESCREWWFTPAGSICILYVVWRVRAAPRDHATAKRALAKVAAGGVIGAIAGSFIRTDRWEKVEVTMRAAIVPGPEDGLGLTLSLPVRF